MPPSRAEHRHLLAAHLRLPPADIDAPLPTLLLSIKPGYADLIALGLKRIEFRRRFPRHVATARALFYASSPTRAITLAATIAQVRRGRPAALWDAYAPLAGLPRPAFDAYFADSTTGVALLLQNVTPLPHPIPLADPRLRALHFRPPQSLAVLDADSPLLRIVNPG
jgi:predicted transcriptional regulator